MWLLDADLGPFRDMLGQKVGIVLPEGVLAEGIVVGLYDIFGGELDIEVQDVPDLDYIGAAKCDETKQRPYSWHSITGA